MAILKQEVERATAEQFAEWLASTAGREIVFKRFGEDPPDLIYSEAGGSGDELPIEVTTVYHDEKAHAKLLWGDARGNSTARSYSKVSANGFAADLSRRIALEIAKKVDKKLDHAKVTLLIYVRSFFVELEELRAVLQEHPAPGCDRFAGVYVVGQFPTTTDSAGGRHVLAIKSLRKE